jgi:SAUR family protein
MVKPVPALPGATCGKVPAGHVPMVVGAEGEDMQRFIVPAELLGRPPIVELLRRAAQEYKYTRRGPLRIPFPVVTFRRLLGALTGTAAAVGPDGGLTFACFAMVVWDEIPSVAGSFFCCFSFLEACVVLSVFLLF